MTRQKRRGLVVLFVGLCLLPLRPCGAAAPDASGIDWIKDDKGCLASVAGYPLGSLHGNKVMWTGLCKDGYEDGPGRQELYVNGYRVEYYEGVWVHGKRQGKGVDRFADGSSFVDGRDWSVFEGFFKDNFAEGPGSLRFRDGTGRSGEYHLSHLEGQGTSTESAGNYVGNWHAGKKEGQGTFNYTNGASYVGSWHLNRQEGQGIFKYANGDVLSGIWANGEIVEKEGEVAFSDKNGGRYVGGYHLNKREGQGTYTFPSGATYVGGWHLDKQEGQGTLKYPTGDVISGTWANDELISGEGTRKYPNGTIYTGSLRGNVKDGQGTLKYTDGGSYVGGWVHDKKEGTGALHYPNGDVLAGTWVDDSFKDGQGARVDAFRRREEGKFVDGKLWQGVRIQSPNPDGTILTQYFEDGKATGGKNCDERARCKLVDAGGWEEGSRYYNGGDSAESSSLASVASAITMAAQMYTQIKSAESPRQQQIVVQPPAVVQATNSAAVTGAGGASLGTASSALTPAYNPKTIKLGPPLAQAATANTQSQAPEPPRDSRRPLGLSQAGVADSVCC